MKINEQEIRDFLREYETATNSHDFSKVVNFIHRDAIYRFTDGDFFGIESIKEAFEKTFATIQEETYSLSDLKVITLDIETASVTYTFKWTGIVNGKRKQGHGRGTNVIVRSGEKLQFIYEHLSL